MDPDDVQMAAPEAPAAAIAASSTAAPLAGDERFFTSGGQPLYGAGGYYATHPQFGAGYAALGPNGMRLDRLSIGPPGNRATFARGPGDPSWNPDPMTQQHVQQLEAKAEQVAHMDNLNEFQKADILARIKAEQKRRDPTGVYSRGSMLHSATPGEKFHAQNAIYDENNKLLGWVDGKGTVHQYKPEKQDNQADIQAEKQREFDLKRQDMVEKNQMAREDARRKHLETIRHNIALAGKGKDASGNVLPVDPKEAHEQSLAILSGQEDHDRDNELLGPGSGATIWGDKGTPEGREHFEAAKRARENNDPQAVEAIRVIHRLTKLRPNTLRPDERALMDHAWQVASRYFPEGYGKKPEETPKPVDTGVLARPIQAAPSSATPAQAPARSSMILPRIPREDLQPLRG